MLTSEKRRVAVLYLCYVNSREHNNTCGRLVKRCEDVEQGSLAGAAFAHNSDIFTLCGREADVSQCDIRLCAEPLCVDLFKSRYFK